MKVITEVVAAKRSGAQRWTGRSMVSLTLCAEGDHDNRTFVADIPGHLERSLPVGRRVAIILHPLKDRKL